MINLSKSKNNLKNTAISNNDELLIYKFIRVMFKFEIFIILLEIIHNMFYVTVYDINVKHFNISNIETDFYLFFFNKDTFLLFIALGIFYMLSKMKYE